MAATRFKKVGTGKQKSGKVSGIYKEELKEHFATDNRSVT